MVNCIKGPKEISLDNSTIHIVKAVVIGGMRDRGEGRISRVIFMRPMVTFDNYLMNVQESHNLVFQVLLDNFVYSRKIADRAVAINTVNGFITL